MKSSSAQGMAIHISYPIRGFPNRQDLDYGGLRLPSTLPAQQLMQAS